MSKELGAYGSWLETAFSEQVVARSLKVSLVVGTVLVAINQGDLLISGQFGDPLFWKIPMTYCVPYAVSTFASVDALRQRR